MTILNFLSDNQLSMSYEVFPPSLTSNFKSVKRATEKIASLKPAFMSVTYGAGGGSNEHTINIAKNIKEKYNVPMVAHLTCVSSSKKLIEEKIEEIKKADIKNIMALRGDIPTQLKNSNIKNWDYQYASQLVTKLKKTEPNFCIGGACYPEVHPESKNQKEDLKYLKEKVDAGCDFLTTQMFFDNNLFYNFMYKAREAGINVPILPGIMPITNSIQVERAINLSKSFMPQRFKSIVDKFGNDPKAMKQAGIAYATDQIIDLYANGITNVHVYSMNKPDVAESILNNLSNILGKNFSE